MLVFAYIHYYMAHDIEQRTDAWLTGEVDVLADVAARTPKDALYDRVVKEVAELASREVPNRQRSSEGRNDSVFFLQSSAGGALALWVGEGSGVRHLDAISKRQIRSEDVVSVKVPGYRLPFRVASEALPDGSRIYLGLSERDQRIVLRNLRFRVILLWLAIVLLGFVIVFFVTRRMLGHVRAITEAASNIGQSEVKGRVPLSRRHDEVAQLALTLNHMLDRIENTVHQLHTITDSLAHDLRSPLTAIRGKLELYLAHHREVEAAETIVAAIDELDRLTDFLTKSLDVAEAKADALRLQRAEIDLDSLFRVMVDLYEPSMSERGIAVRFESAAPLIILADAELIHRMTSNLFDNEMKHLPSSCTVVFCLRAVGDLAEVRVEDDGPGFAPEVQPQLFEWRSKGRGSSGHGLGLAFVHAVVHAHGGSIEAANRPRGGASLVLQLPLAPAGASAGAHPLLVANG